MGGWSYGGILTDYTIATDGRFKAAVSGAGVANQLAMYGVDQYILQWDNEIGPPWKTPEVWMKISYPFLHADRIKTPTLFLGGQKFAETIVPWACLWLYYYEVWHATGEWLGGGLHPSARRPRRRA